MIYLHIYMWSAENTYLVQTCVLYKHLMYLFPMLCTVKRTLILLLYYLKKLRHYLLGQFSWAKFVNKIIYVD